MCAQEYSIRASTPEDDVGIRKVQVTTWKEAYRGMIPDHILDPMSVDNPPRRLKSPDPVLTKSRRAFVALNDASEIVGFVLGGNARSPDWNYESELWAIYVLPTEQGKGIGKKLFEAFFSNIRRDYKDMIIWVLEKNHPSHKFYESLGGTRLPFEKSFQWENEPVAMEVAYGWQWGQSID